jgi:hypothetical protein
MCRRRRRRRFTFIGAILLLNATATAMCFFAAAVSKNAGTANLWASRAWRGVCLHLPTAACGVRAVAATGAGGDNGIAQM